MELSPRKQQSTAHTLSHDIHKHNNHSPCNGGGNIHKYHQEEEEEEEEGGKEEEEDMDKKKKKRVLHTDLILHDAANLVLLPMVSMICVAGLTGAIAPRFSTFVIFFYILGDLVWVLKRPKAIPGLYWVIITHHLVVLLLVRLISRPRRTHTALSSHQTTTSDCLIA